MSLESGFASKTVLVTGGTGFVGRALWQRLLEKQTRVHILARSQLSASPDVASSVFFQGDINDKTVLRAACTGVDTIFHLAAYAHVNQHDTRAMREVNVEGTRSLLAAAKSAGVRRIVYFSSILADTELYPQLTEYGRAKRDAESLLLAAASAGEIEVCCLRPANVYGLGMKGNLLSVLRLIHKGLMPPLPLPSASLSLVGSADLCEAALLASESTKANQQIYAVTDGKTYTMKGIELTARRTLGREAFKWQLPKEAFYVIFAGLELLGKVLRLPNAPGLRSYRALTVDTVVASEKIQQELGYNPASSLSHELPEILQQIAASER